MKSIHDMQASCIVQAPLSEYHLVLILKGKDGLAAVSFWNGALQRKTLLSLTRHTSWVY